LGVVGEGYGWIVRNATIFFWKDVVVRIRSAVAHETKAKTKNS